MSLFSKAKDKKKAGFATGIFRNPESGQKINTDLHGSNTKEGFKAQGFSQFGSKDVKGGKLFSQNIGGGKEYQEFVQTPKENKTMFSPTAGAGKSSAVPNNSARINQNNSEVSETVDTPYQPSESGISAPDFMSSLSPQDETLRQESLDLELSNIHEEASQEIDNIRDAGKKKIGAAKGFLAKIGALGRTVSGAPVDTNLGVLSDQNNMIQDAMAEARTNRDNAKAAAKIGSAEAANEQLEAYNKLIQTNFDNALKIVQEDREMRAEDRADRLADLQFDKLSFDIEKANYEMSKENMEDAITDIDRMAESGIAMDQLSLELINSLETGAGLPAGSFEAYYQAKQDAQALANEENLLKLEKAKVDIMNIVEDNELARKKEERMAADSARSLSISGGNLALSREKFDYKKTQDQGGPVDSIDDFAQNYMANAGKSIDSNAPEVQAEYDKYVTWQKAQNLLSKYQEDPTSGYKDYVLAGGEETGMDYDKWYSTFKKSLEDRIAEGIPSGLETDK